MQTSGSLFGFSWTLTVVVLASDVSSTAVADTVRGALLQYCVVSHESLYDPPPSGAPVPIGTPSTAKRTSRMPKKSLAEARRVTVPLTVDPWAGEVHEAAGGRLFTLTVSWDQARATAPSYWVALRTLSRSPREVVSQSHRYWSPTGVVTVASSAPSTRNSTLPVASGSPTAAATGTTRSHPWTESGDAIAMPANRCPGSQTNRSIHAVPFQ